MWTLKPDERLREWKSFRDQIGQQNLESACQSVVHLWSYAPYISHYLDYNRKNSLIKWPDPWTLLYENSYCDVAKALGMLYTLYFTKHKPDDIELIIYKDNKNREVYNLVSLAQGKYILNFSFDEVVNKEQLPNNLTVQHRYTVHDLELDLY